MCDRCFCLLLRNLYNEWVLCSKKADEAGDDPKKCKPKRHNALAICPIEWVSLAPLTPRVSTGNFKVGNELSFGVFPWIRLDSLKSPLLKNRNAAYPVSLGFILRRRRSGTRTGRRELSRGSNKRGTRPPF